MDQNINPSAESFFDIKFNLWGWADDADNYRIIADLIPQVSDTHELIVMLDEVNNILAEKQLPHIFDGTIGSLIYFIENHEFDLNRISNPLLKETVEKHLFNPKDSAQIKMNLNRWSAQALRCKAVLVGLYMKNGKYHIVRGLKAGAEFTRLSEFDFPLMDDDIEMGRIPTASVARLTSLNATWSILSSMPPWNQGNMRDTGMFIMEQMTRSYQKGSFFYNLFEKLQPRIDQVALKYFPEFHKTDHRACVAVRHAAMIVLYRVLTDMPKNAEHHPTYRVDGIMNKWLEYIYTPDFQFQEWFLDYLDVEMDKRISFLKMLADARIFIEEDPEIEKIMKDKMKDKYKPPTKDRLYYIPVFESFRLVAPGSINLFGRLVTVFHDKSISIKTKDDIAKNIIFNLQKIVAVNSQNRKLSNFDKYFGTQEKIINESFMLLIINILIPLARKTVKDQYDNLKLSSSEFEDLKQIVSTEIIVSLLKYDSSRNDSFFGYIKTILPYNVKSALREHKTEVNSSSLEDLLEQNPEKLSVSSNVEEVVRIDELQRQVADCLDKLPDKEKAAIKKAYFKNEKLNDTERKAKNRGLKKLESQYPELKELLD